MICAKPLYHSAIRLQIGMKKNVKINFKIFLKLSKLAVVRVVIAKMNKPTI